MSRTREAGLRHNLVHDLAALNKAEMLLWDSWGLIQREQLPERDLELLDHLARITRSGGAAFDELGASTRLRLACGCRTW